MCILPQIETFKRLREGKYTVGEPNHRHLYQHTPALTTTRHASPLTSTTTLTLSQGIDVVGSAHGQSLVQACQRRSLRRDSARGRQWRCAVIIQQCL